MFFVSVFFSCTYSGKSSMTFHTSITAVRQACMITHTHTHTHWIFYSKSFMENSQ